MAEKATPVTPEEADDIRVPLELDNGRVESKNITNFVAAPQVFFFLKT